MLEMKEVQIENKKLETIMRIPEKQKNFLAKKGTLEFFVEAAALGKDSVAKWTLLESSKKEINRYLKRKETTTEMMLSAGLETSERSLSSDDNPNLTKIRKISKQT